MKFSLDELVAINGWFEFMKARSTMELRWHRDQAPYNCQRQAARNELTRRSLFKKGRGE